MCRLAPLAMLVLTLGAPAGAEGEHGYLGIRIDDLTTTTRAAFRIPKQIETGALVVEVLEKTPAEAAGLRAGDVIVALGDKAIPDREGLIACIKAHRPGDTVSYRVRRGTGVIEGTFTLARKEEPPEQEMPPPAPPRERTGPEPQPVQPARADLEGRLDRAQNDIAELRKRLLEARERAAPLRHPHSLDGWIHKEELAAEEARRRGDTEKMRYHAIRLSVLREMRETEFTTPARRLDRIEKKLDEVIQELRRMR